jgi:hypothetical protein
VTGEDAFPRLSRLAAVIVLTTASIFAASFVGDRAASAGATGTGGVPHVWNFKQVVGSRTVQISVGWTGCDRSLAPSMHPTVREGRGKAIITIFEEARPVPSGTRCLKVRRKRLVSVRLRRPLEGLDLYDGATSPPVKRSSALSAAT